MRRRKQFGRGFTLVELLVTIAIVVVLAGLSLAFFHRGKKRAESVKIIANMRQIGTLLATHAAENGNRLPPARADIALESGGWGQLHWFEALLQLLYPDLDPQEWRNEDWWTRNEPLLRHPEIDEKTKPWAWAWWNPGFALNRQIVDNLDPEGYGWNWAPGKHGPQTYAIPLTSIDQPSRTPIVAPRGDWHFTYNDQEIKEPGLKQFLIDGKMPILFVDGHVEMMTLDEYQERELDELPRR